ncbi:MAG: hydroxyacid dehydrogenase [Oscillospiraceae bacterium]|nr:hydroxyacid dehydrogenase [Oscillospiraceae bacterium]
MESALPFRFLSRYPPHAGDTRTELASALAGMKRKIVVLDDDPTGVQTVNGIYVYTAWDTGTMLEAFRSPEQMFFILTNSRGLTVPESRRQHEEIAGNLAAASNASGIDYLLLSRGDSTLRGHWPMETEVLRNTLEPLTGKQYDGEVIYPFFPEGGRYTVNSVHYVRQGELLVPAGQTEFAKDKSFGYEASSLPAWCEEKSAGRYPAGACCRIDLPLLRSGDSDRIAAKLASVKRFEKIVVDSIDYEDTAVFVTALCRALEEGKEFLFRCAAALPKVLGSVPDRPLLKREDLLDADNRNGGIILVGSHVDRTSRQLAALRESACPIAFLEFNQHRVLESGGLEDEADRVLRQAEALLSTGKSVAVYTRRERLDLDSADSDRQLQISVRISDALTGIIGNLSVRPSFIVAKGGITSSDIGTKALHVRKALVKGQIRPGIPVWQTGEESKFPGLPFVIFPGNVGDDLDLLRIADTLTATPAD